MWRVLTCLFVATGTAGVARAEDARVTLRVQHVPFRAALEQVYQGTGITVQVDAEVPDPPISADLRDVSRVTAARILLRLTGTPYLALEENGREVRVRRVPPPPPPVPVARVSVEPRPKPSRGVYGDVVSPENDGTRSYVWRGSAPGWGSCSRLRSGFG